MNIYNGNITTDTQGNATVVLPDYFEALNGDFRYQLTVIGRRAQAIVASEIKNNRFSINTDHPDVKVSWQVTGIRQDASAKAFPSSVEEEKPEAERGLFLHPEHLAIQGSGESLSHAIQTICTIAGQRGHGSCHTIAPHLWSNSFSPQPEEKRHLMPIDQTMRGLALEIDASLDPASEAQPVLEYRFIDLASTQTILARIKGIPQPNGGGELAFETNAGGAAATQRMLIDSNGNVGIGTGNPAARLDVVGDAKFSGPLSVQGALRVEGVAQVDGDLSVTGKLTAASFAGDAAGLSNVTPADNSVANVKLARDAASLSKVTDGKMVISGGNVGVGTDNPGAKLDVAGDAKFKGPLEVQGTLTVSGSARVDTVAVGGNGQIGQIGIDEANGKNTIMIGGPQGAARIGIGGNNSRGQVAIFDENTKFTINLGGAEGAARIGLGGNGSIGTIDVFDAASKHTIRIGSAQGPGRIGLGGNGSDGVIDVFDANSNQTIKINGKTGEVGVSNADCAEEFDVCETEQIEPGMVMVLGEEGKLVPSQKAYDKRVAGVVSGAGDYKPGIVLGKQQSNNTRQPIALLGKVYCKVDTQYGSIEVGDLLTTSCTLGHAMKAADPLKALGTVIGKALRPLAQGQGLIPILISLQ